MRWKKLSRKQLSLMTWWIKGGYDAVIADGSIRSGKSLCMSVSFVLWAMHSFNGEQLAICGRSREAVNRNVFVPLSSGLAGICKIEENRTASCFTVSYKGRSNKFYIFGGRDESSYKSIQGVTLAGVMFDEAALMPQSFVSQAMARCSVEGSKLWFNCNPESPEHWFKREWIDKAAERRALYIHFTMEDNLSLSIAVRERYERLFSGVFYRRYVLGEWVRAEGLVYDMFERERHVADTPPSIRLAEYYISVDYGTVNPFSAGLWCLDRLKGTAVRLREFYYDSRKLGRQMTDEEYYRELEALAGGLPIRYVVVDPSAASFIECVRRHGKLRVRAGENRVNDGIHVVASLLAAGKLKFCACCKDTIREFALYSWDEGTGSRDAVKKENDHAMDDVRYFCNTVLRKLRV